MLNHKGCLALLLLPMAAMAHDHRPEDWPVGSAMHTGRTAQVSLEAADKRLNAIYQRLLQTMPDDDADDYPKKVLIQAQRAWIRFRDAECALSGETEGGMRMWKSAYDTVCRARMTEARVKRLQELLEAYPD